MYTLKTAFIYKETLMVQGIVSLLNQNGISGFEYKGLYPNLEDFIEHAEDINLVISDIDLENPYLKEYVPRIKKKFPEARVIILTIYDNYKLVRDMMKSGADGYLLRNISFGSLIKAIEEVMDGEAHIGKGLQLTPSKSFFNKKEQGTTDESIINRYEHRFEVRQKLTRRELEVLKLITEVKNNNEIAQELYISSQTVAVHKKNIMRKLNVRSTIALIKYAMEQNLV